MTPTKETSACTHYEDQQGLCHVCGVLLNRALWEEYAGKGQPAPGDETDVRTFRVTINVRVSSKELGIWPLKASEAAIAGAFAYYFSDYRDGRHCHSTELVESGLSALMFSAVGSAEWDAHKGQTKPDYVACNPAEARAVNAIYVRVDTSSISVLVVPVGLNVAR